MIKSLGIDISRASQACHMSLVVHGETVSPLSDSLDSLGSLSTSGKIIHSPSNETISPSSKAF